MVNLIIKVNRGRAFKQYLPIFIPFIFSFCFVLYLNTVPEPLCSHFFGINISYLTLFFLSYLLPGVILLSSFGIAKIGYKSLQSGYFPPEGYCSFFREFVAKKGRSAIIFSYISITFPVFAIILIIVGHYTYLDITDGLSYYEIIQIIESECTNNALHGVRL